VECAAINSITLIIFYRVNYDTKQGSVKMNYKYSISLDIPYDVYKYIENNHGKLSYSDYIEKIIREHMNEQVNIRTKKKSL
jgi:hypothetical protein